MAPEDGQTGSTVDSSYNQSWRTRSFLKGDRESFNRIFQITQCQDWETMAREKDQDGDRIDGGFSYDCEARSSLRRSHFAGCR